MSSLKKNLGYQTIYQVLNTCLPLITSPYLARTLGVIQQGVFSYTQSIVNYFALIAMLGVVNYGTRVIAEEKESFRNRSIQFWNIYVLQFCLSLICISIYIIYAIFFCRENKIIVMLQIFYLLGALVDINWLFFGVEKFEITVKRSLMIRITSVVLILLLVKRPEDLWIYVVIMSGSTFFANLVLWFFVPHIIDIYSIREIRMGSVLNHVKPNIILFVPLAAMSVYHIMDKTMLGALSTYEQSGFYYNADKIINIPIGIITGVGTVMMPRTVVMILSGKQDSVNKLFNISIELITVVAIAMSFGISAISKEFTPFFFGNGFEPCIRLIILLSPVLVIKGWSNVVRTQYLVPAHKENIFIQSVFIGAIVNFIVNICLIPKMGATGAVIGTVIAELIACVWQFIRMYGQIGYLSSVIKAIIYVIFGLVMYIGVRFVSNYFLKGFIGIICEVIVGGIIYLLLCVLYWIFSRSPLWDIIKGAFKFKIK